jgi:hypothetical protein
MAFDATLGLLVLQNLTTPTIHRRDGARRDRGKVAACKWDFQGDPMMTIFELARLGADKSFAEITFGR